MNTCACGNSADSNGTTCLRCAALQELGLNAGATDAEIKSAHRLYVKAWHPDRFPGDETSKNAAQEKLKAVNSSYDFLTSSPSKSGRPYRPKPAAHPAPPREPSQRKQASAKQSPPAGERGQENPAKTNASGQAPRRPPSPTTPPPGLAPIFDPSAFSVIGGLCCRAHTLADGAVRFRIGRARRASWAY
jgi:curved DNA-binding protein CbpA